MTSIFHSGLSKDFSSILYDSDDFNVTIQVGENKNMKKFLAHSVILRARSSYFKSAFSANWILKEDNMILFNKPNITPTVFELILKYIYTGELDLTKQSGEDILRLLVSTDELLIEELFNHVQDYLINKKTSWVHKNFVIVLHTVSQLTSCKKLQDYCIKTICKDPHPLISSKAFPLLDEEILFDLLERDDFQIEEIAAWKCLIKWGIKRTPGLESDSNRTKWNNKNYEALKKTLEHLIPLIRFVKISYEDFFNEVRPYKAIIPDYIYEEVIEFYDNKTLPITTPFQSRTGTLISKIIKPKFANVIANWIDENDTTPFSINNKYIFNLIYLMSRDGLDSRTFYKKCNGKGPFLVLVRVPSKEIYGGYDPIGRAGSDRWQTSTKSFVFSLENDRDTCNMKIGRIINSKSVYSVFDYYNGDGYFSFGGILYISEKKLNVGFNNSNYENIFDYRQSHLIEEIEVFNIIKK
ncbi:hypothetical protein RclHR1_03680010 [Rhizophagus clarus]|uniref:BTB domain-containing protein n=1 Tax=Rhizophagus clarus TaxID=94130 RepID=A0A2Z6RBS9_9GLOM|nr:hypothetical protein RclHR1_03680010 [Rhizophagus clarus]GES76416.1 hypothetical protein GLOIN_2v1480807 [Rhizophagus clarus]